MENKLNYQEPNTEVIKLELEGVILDTSGKDMFFGGSF
jgi:hypothetical protein